MIKKTLAGVLSVASLSVSTLGIAQVQNNLETPAEKGFYFHKDALPPEQEANQPKKENPNKPQQYQFINKNPPYTAAWVKDNILPMLDFTLSNPTVENVRYYKYMERLMLDIAYQFAEASKKAVESDPYLNENVRFPYVSLARVAGLNKIDEGKHKAISAISEKAGLFVFIDSSCKFCQEQIQILHTFQKEEASKTMPIFYVSIDNVQIKGIDDRQIKYDQNGNMARKFGLRITPSIVLAIPPDKYAIVSQGLSDRGDLQDKIVAAGFELKLIPQELVREVDMQNRGIISNEALTSLRANNPLPKQASDLMKYMQQPLSREYDDVKPAVRNVGEKNK